MYVTPTLTVRKMPGAAILKRKWDTATEAIIIKVYRDSVIQ